MDDEKVYLNTHTHGLAFRYCYRTVIKAVEERYDVRGSSLAQLVQSCLERRGRVPPALRVRYTPHVRQEALTYIELITARLLFGPYGRLSPHEYRYRECPVKDDT